METICVSDQKPLKMSRKFVVCTAVFFFKNFCNHVKLCLKLDSTVVFCAQEGISYITPIFLCLN